MGMNTGENNIWRVSSEADSTLLDALLLATNEEEIKSAALAYYDAFKQTKVFGTCASLLTPGSKLASAKHILEKDSRSSGRETLAHLASFMWGCDQRSSAEAPGKKARSVSPPKKSLLTDRRRSVSRRRSQALDMSSTMVPGPMMGSMYMPNVHMMPHMMPMMPPMVHATRESFEYYSQMMPEMFHVLEPQNVFLLPYPPTVSYPPGLTENGTVSYPPGNATADNNQEEEEEYDPQEPINIPVPQ